MRNSIDATPFYIALATIVVLYVTFNILLAIS